MKDFYVINIEIHGLGRPVAERIEKKIFELFKNFEQGAYYKNVVIAIFDHPVKEFNGQEYSFLRIYHGDLAPIGDFVKLLSPLDMNIQKIVLKF